MMGRKERECAHTGTMTMAGTFGCTIDAPAAAAYAVLPVGVEIMRPTCKTSKSLNKYSEKSLKHARYKYIVQTISLDRRDAFVFDVKIKVSDESGRTSVDDHLVQHLQQPPHECVTTFVEYV